MVNQSFTTLDDVTQVLYNGSGTGAYTDVKPGMTMYVSATAYGAYDLGMVRIRKAPTADTLFIGSTSDIAWATGLYLTVVNEFNLWARPWKTVDENTVLMDSDIMYADQNTKFDPAVIMGPDVVLWMTGSTIAFTPTAAGWVFDSTITGYVWTAVGRSAESGMDSATPTITYDTVGHYFVSCTVTAANGKSSTGYRSVFVVSDANPPTPVILDGASGDAQSGGWTFDVTMYDNADQSYVRDCAKAVLYAKDSYGGVAGSIGPLVGYEGIVGIGWINGESIDRNAEQSSVKFTISGLQYWLNALEAFGCGLIQQADITDWKYIATLTLDRALWNALYWRSTVLSTVDVYMSNDVRQNAGLIAPEGSIWSQLVYFANKILSYPRSNRYGQLFFEVDTQYIPYADRITAPTIIPVVIALQSGDWRSDDNIQIERSTLSRTAMIDTAGTGDTDTEVYYSRAPGSSFSKFGQHQTHDQLMIATQDQCNVLAGLLLAQANNLYPTVDIPLSMNNRLIDIAPNQLITLSLASGDTPRGIVWDPAKRLIPRHLQYTHDQVSGELMVDVSCEAETFGPPGVTYIPPLLPIVTIPPQPIIVPPIWPIIPMPYVPPGVIPPVVPPVIPPIIIPSCATDIEAAANGPYGLAMGGTIWNYGPTDPRASYMPCVIRSENHVNKTRVAITGSFLKTEDQGVTWVPDLTNTWYLFQALGTDGSVIATAVWDEVVDNGTGTRLGTISLPASTMIQWFVLALVIGNPLYYVYPPILATGAIPVTEEGGVALAPVDPNAMYAVEGKPGTGPWNNGSGDSYEIQVGKYEPAADVYLSFNSCTPDVGITYVEGYTPEVHFPWRDLRFGSVDEIIFDCSSTCPVGTQLASLTGGTQEEYGQLWLGLDGVWTQWKDHFPVTPAVETFDQEFDQIKVTIGYVINMDAVFSVGKIAAYDFDYGLHKDEVVVAPNKRLYFYGNVNEVVGNNVRVDDEIANVDQDFNDNTGSIDYNLWHAGVVGDKRIDVASVNLFNICGV
jgi:hypothetical protein